MDTIVHKDGSIHFRHPKEPYNKQAPGGCVDHSEPNGRRKIDSYNQLNLHPPFAMPWLDHQTVNYKPSEKKRVQENEAKMSQVYQKTMWRAKEKTGDNFFSKNSIKMPKLILHAPPCSKKKAILCGPFGYKNNPNL